MHYSKIFLIGYRATGKTTVGKIISNHLSFEFVDMDKVIEARENAPIRTMVDSHGWEYFRKKESLLLEELSFQPNNLVVATGGGAILHQTVWPKVMAAGMVVWLTADLGTICARLAGDSNTTSQRPSLTGSGTEQEVAAVLAEREPLYRAGSHFSIDTGNKTVAEIVETVLLEYKNTEAS